LTVVGLAARRLSDVISAPISTDRRVTGVTIDPLNPFIETFDFDPGRDAAKVNT
jgi:hypothetical protein